ncbi:TRAP transporter small permease [Brevibacillus humidisoli]|uniref:TRAP transporter small permease n=1 Tax=Brevibacillus humidisoli TaxID=2895522 RepID=UPI001E44EE78|nr:TRAP transporter small permease [Brevibacillus humidisoli]UFJ40865.1 TRAP transporter small permease [Brevibacillus humidisoli]
MKLWVRLEEWLLVLMMSVICLLTMANVLSRYVLASSFSFTEELTTNLFAFVIFIGAALLARESGHIGFSLLTDLVPVPLRRAALIVVGCLTSVFFAVLLWYGLEMVMQQYEYGQKTPAMGLPAWWMGLSVPLGAVLCLFRFWEGYIRVWSAMTEIEDGPDGEDRRGEE